MITNESDIATAFQSALRVDVADPPLEVEELGAYLDEIAGLPDYVYEQVRARAIELTGMRPDRLDKAIERLRASKSSPGTSKAFREDTPHPVKVDGSDLLVAICDVRGGPGRLDRE